MTEALQMNMTATVETLKPVEQKKDKLHQLSEALTVLRDHKFTGYIKVNFTQGTIGRVEKFEEILRKKTI